MPTKLYFQVKLEDLSRVPHGVYPVTVWELCMHGFLASWQTDMMVPFA
uniref:Uncharacterized protein n=1 Tax=Arundo donax TaxID=35708 RepID=A0A0A9EDN1_ARUDO